MGKCDANLRKYGTGPFDTPLQSIIKQYSLQRVHILNLEQVERAELLQVLLGVDFAATNVDIVSLGDVQPSVSAAVQAVNVLRALGFDTIEDPDAEHAGTLMHRIARVQEQPQLTIKQPVYGFESKSTNMACTFAIEWGGVVPQQWRWEGLLNGRSSVAGNSSLAGFFIDTKSLEVTGAHVLEVRAYIGDTEHLVRSSDFTLFYQEPAKVRAEETAIEVDMSRDVREAFSKVYSQGIWLEGDPKAGESYSGHSSVSKTVEVRKVLKQVIEEFDIKSMIDAPCGDMTYMSYFLKNEAPPSLEYTGMDIVPFLIQNHRKKYANTTWSFEQKDLSVDPVNKTVDLIYSRAMMQHLPMDIVQAILVNFENSGAKYVLMTCYLNCLNNQDMSIDHITKGYFAPHNYLVSPFNLDFPLRFYREADPKLYPGMYLGLWELPFGRNKILP